MPCLLAAFPAPAQSPPAARLISHGGTVLIRDPGPDRSEGIARDGQPVAVGGAVRTLALSLARVQFADRSQLELGEQGTLEILPAEEGARLPILELLGGVLYFFGREPPRQIQVRTRYGTGATLSTEFQVAVAPGRAVFTVTHGTLELTNALGSTNVSTGFEGILEDGRAPYNRPVLEARNILQWWLYYPAVVEPASIALPALERDWLGKSLAAYAHGDLVAGLESWPAYPRPWTPESADGRILLAALLLGNGHIAQAQHHLASVRPGDPRAIALHLLIQATQSPESAWIGTPTTPSEWLAASYYLQARHALPQALDAARKAVDLAPGFAFARVRLAELLFSHGAIVPARRALAQGLAQAPDHAEAHALNGFLLAAENRIDAALHAFQRAIDLAPNLGSGWLGRGLCRIRQGDEDGRGDLQVAAALEARRSLYRSYLGKADGDAGDWERSADSLRRARELDPADPTPWLYSAVVAHESRNLGEAIRNLMESEARTENRRLFRSQLLLDQDRAVGSANLAAMFRDAGLQEVSVREAARAVDADYANYSAHLFLANSYDALRDPRLVTLRYDSAWARELLIANLLAPVGAGSLSQQVSHQEYSRLFERDGPHLSSATHYRSDGNQLQTAASQYGTFGRTSYAVDGTYRTEDGPDGALGVEAITLAAKAKIQLWQLDHLFLQAVTEDFRGQDLFRHRDPTQSNPGLRVEESSEPVLLVGYHRHWSEHQRTVLLLGHIDARQHLEDPQRPTAIAYSRIRNGAPTLVGLTPLSVRQDYETTLGLWSAELQHIGQWDSGNVVAGLSWQDGTFDTSSRMTDPTTPRLLPDPIPDQDISTGLDHRSAYLYLSQDVYHGLRLTGGLAYNELDYPLNHRYPPISALEGERRQLSPKAGLVWEFSSGTTLRAAYSESLGGVSFENRYRLEPTQVSGFNQAYRDLIPELRAGPETAPSHTVAGVSLEQELGRRTFLAVSFERLDSEEDQVTGAFLNDQPGIATGTIDLTRAVSFEEHNLTVTAHHLLSDQWSLGSTYLRSWVTLAGGPIAGLVPPASGEATLDQWNLWLRFFHRRGPFASLTSRAYWQDSQPVPGASAAPASEQFLQLDASLGYRLPRRRAELEVGVLNIFDQAHDLDALNLFPAIPRERAVAVSFKFTF